MSFIHYLLFLPLAIICGAYVRFKLNQIYSVKKKISNFLYYFIVILIFSFSFTNLSFFTVFLAYTSLFYLLFDVIFILVKKCKFNKIFSYLKKLYLHGFTVFFLSIIITCYGIYNAEHLVVKHYSFTVNKNVKQNYKIALMSDLHYGTGTYIKDLEFIVDNINKEQVDIFLMVGDIFDEATKKNEKQEFYKMLKRIKTKYGIFMVEGNHDISKTCVNDNLEKQGVIILSDTYQLINGDFYLVGRKDKLEKRKTLNTLLDGINKTHTIILLDHRPVEIFKASKVVDLQFSGHTHKGQLWPGNFFVRSGVCNMNDYTLYTTSGIGTWGVPIRTSGSSELVIINLLGKNIYDIIA